MADDPTLYQAAYRAGAVLLDLDRPSEAAVALREAIAHCPRDQNPSDPPADPSSAPPSDDFFHGGNVQRLVRAAIEGPSLAECWTALSDALDRAGRSEEARDAARRAAELAAK